MICSLLVPMIEPRTQCESFGSAENNTPRSGSDAQTSSFGAGELDEENIVEAHVDPVNKTLMGTKVAVLSFASGKYSRLYGYTFRSKPRDLTYHLPN